jgi:hypothetical protein
MVNFTAIVFLAIIYYPSFNLKQDVSKTGLCHLQVFRDKVLPVEGARSSLANAVTGRYFK